MDDDADKDLFDFDFEYSNMSHFIQLGCEMDRKKKEENLKEQEQEQKKEKVIIANASFQWNKHACIHKILNQNIRDLCIVMFQSITLLDLWTAKEPWDKKIIIQTMQKLGYINSNSSTSTMDRYFQQAICVMNRIKNDL